MHTSYTHIYAYTRMCMYTQISLEEQGETLHTKVNNATGIKRIDERQSGFRTDTYQTFAGFRYRTASQRRPQASHSKRKRTRCMNLVLITMPYRTEASGP